MLIFFDAYEQLIAFSIYACNDHVFMTDNLKRKLRVLLGLYLVGVIMNMGLVFRKQTWNFTDVFMLLIRFKNKTKILYIYIYIYPMHLNIKILHM